MAKPPSFSPLHARSPPMNARCNQATRQSCCRPTAHSLTTLALRKPPSQTPPLHELAAAGPWPCLRDRGAGACTGPFASGTGAGADYCDAAGPTPPAVIDGDGGRGGAGGAGPRFWGLIRFWNGLAPCDGKPRPKTADLGAIRCCTPNTNRRKAAQAELHSCPSPRFCMTVPFTSV